jgi:hypothetical protein
LNAESSLWRAANVKKNNISAGFASSSAEWCLLETLNTWDMHQPAKCIKTPAK